MGEVAETLTQIARRPGIRGGNAVIVGTRVGVHDVIGLLQTGETVETVRKDCLPELSREQVEQCRHYYEDHRAEIDRLVAKQSSG